VRLDVLTDTFLITGGAGFIGSHLTSRLLSEGAHVRVLDNFTAGSLANLPFAATFPSRLEIIRGDVREFATVERAATGVSAIFHQAAMGSVPRSIANPLGANDNNVIGTQHVFEAARRGGVRRVVYASSSSVYGESAEPLKLETHRRDPISPYAVTKTVTEEYAHVWHRLYGLEVVGLRYFNVFGPRQDPASEYAAVIPKFIRWGLAGEPVEVHGDGCQSRDFTYVDNVVDANLLAARVPAVGGEVFNVGYGSSISLLEVLTRLETILGHPVARHHAPPRAGDILYSQADVSKSRRLLGYVPRVGFDEGFAQTVAYFRTT